MTPVRQPICKRFRAPCPGARLRRLCRLQDLRDPRRLRTVRPCAVAWPRCRCPGGCGPFCAEFVETSRKIDRKLAKYPSKSGVSYRISCSFFLRRLSVYMTHRDALFNCFMLYNVSHKNRPVEREANRKPNSKDTKPDTNREPSQLFCS